MDPLIPVNTRTHTTSHTEHVSLMVLPALVSNGQMSLKVKLLDPCSTGWYVSEAAEEELALHGQLQTLGIAGTWGAEVTKRSCRVELTDLPALRQTNLEANVLNNITSDMPAVQCQMVPFKSDPFQRVTKWQQIDVLIGSDHPLFHHMLQDICGNGPHSKTDKPTWSLGLFWTDISGRFSSQNQVSVYSQSYRTSHIRNGESVDDLLRSRACKPGIHTWDEKVAFDHAKKTKQKKDGTRPVRQGEPSFNENYEMALSRKVGTQERP